MTKTRARVQAAAPRKGVGRPSFREWATSPGGLYLPDKKQTLAEFPKYYHPALDYLFPGGSKDIPFRRIIWSAIKKSGKSEMAAGLHLWWAWFVEVPGEQYVVANDLEGGKLRVFEAIRRALEENPYLKQDVNWWYANNTITLDNGSTIRAIPSDVRGEAGGNPSFVTVDEPWGIIHPRSVQLMSEFLPVPTRKYSTVFYTGYQGFPESEWWHTFINMSRDVGQGSYPHSRLQHLKDGQGQPAFWQNDGAGVFSYWDHEGRFPWHTEAYLKQQRMSMPRSEYLRVWQNERVESVDALCDRQTWEELGNMDMPGLAYQDERPLIIGIDAAAYNDTSALVAVTINPLSGKLEVLHVEVWKPTRRQAVVLTETILPAVRALCLRHKVRRIVADPSQMVAIIETLRREGLPIHEFTQTTNRTASDTLLHQLIKAGQLTHRNDPDLTEHILNCSVKETPRGLRLVKGTERAKIDAAVALSMAAITAVETLGQKPRVLSVGRNPFYGSTL